jgi:hypothetical protein
MARLKVSTFTMIVRLAVALECDVSDLVDVFNGRDLRMFYPEAQVAHPKQN